MKQYERFGACLKRCLAAESLSATEAAKLVGFRSRNSIFRILAGETGHDVNLRFLSSLHEALKDAWPQQHWFDLQTALSVERLGREQYETNRAFERLLHEEEPPLSATLTKIHPDGSEEDCNLIWALDQAANAARAEHCGKAGAQGRLKIRQYIDTAEATLTQHILGILPLVSMPWYNARLVVPELCPEEMLALYRVHAVHICCWDEAGNASGGMLIRFDKTHFATQWMVGGASAARQVLDRLRFDLELLKPMPELNGGAESFIRYTQNYAQLEANCAILSIKPDVHFNCIPPQVLYPSILEGFEQANIVGSDELDAVIGQLWSIHEARFNNIIDKHRPTHLVYSLPAMERFMQTGVLTDQFYLQRAYTVEERREIIRVLLDAMRSKPWFNVHFFKDEAPMPRYEISCYDGKGVLLMDAYTGYELEADHSEALITLPAFMESFKAFFKDELLAHFVLTRAETLLALERLLVMEVAE